MELLRLVSMLSEVKPKKKKKTKGDVHLVNKVVKDKVLISQ